MAFSEVDDDVNRVIFASKSDVGLSRLKTRSHSVADLSRIVQDAAEARLTADQLAVLVDDLAGFKLH